MSTLVERMNVRDQEVKQILISKLLDDGYGTYAKRLKEFDFVIADNFEGQPVDTAAMCASQGLILINPGFLVAANEKEQKTQMDRLSVLIRHELLHALLMHQRRFIDHMAKQNPDDFKDYTVDTVQRMENMAADWELSERGYDDFDKQVVRNMTLNGRVIGGLILEDDHPEWLGKTFEEIFDLQKPEYDKAIQEAKKAMADQPEIEINVQRASHSPEYVEAYNKIIAKFGNLSEDEITDLLNKVTNMSDIELEDLLK